MTPCLSLLGLAAPPAAAGGPGDLLGPAGVNAVKAAVASAACGLLLWGAWLARRGRGGVHRRLRDGLLLALGAAGLLCGLNLLRFHYPGWLQVPDTYHHYLGAKYFRELGYQRLYACTLVADARAGLDVSDAWVRNLANNRVIPARALLGDPEACTGHFAPERWREFAADVAWFREQVPRRTWSRLRLDHGYNATPVWGALGGALAGTGPASRGQVLALSLLDPALLAVAWAASAWAFGWRAACVALVYWGTNYPASFGWTGGAFLRQDWLVCAVLGICLLRRGRPLSAGFLLTSAALLRVFPGLLLAGIGLAAAARGVRAGRCSPSPADRRLAAGGLLALAALLPLAALGGGGAAAWRDFAENSRLHLSTPLLNHVGLPTLLSYHPDGRYRIAADAAAPDPAARWKEIRRRSFAARAPFFAGLVLLYALLLARVAERQENWLAAVLGIGLVPVATQLTGYYASILLGFAFLWPRRPSVGAALCGLAAASWLATELWHWTDEILTWTSLLMVIFAVYAAWAARGAAPRSAPELRPG